MGRPLRLKGPNLTYHITSRTNGGRLFLKKTKDQKVLCKIINRVLLKYNVLGHGLTPMNNHFHLIIHIKDKADLSQVMCEIKTQYAKYHNKKYNTKGIFWGGRFHSTIIEDDYHMLICLRYIDRNPLKAGLVDHPSKWHLATFRQYAYGEPHPLLHIQPHPTYTALSEDPAKRQRMYSEFVLGPNHAADDLHGRMRRMRVFGSEDFINQIKCKICLL